MQTNAFVRINCEFYFKQFFFSKMLNRKSIQGSWLDRYHCYQANKNFRKAWLLILICGGHMRLPTIIMRAHKWDGMLPL